MIAKREGTCRKCGGHLEAGDEIVWSRSLGARHPSCPARQEGEERVSFADRVEMREERAAEIADKRREWAGSASGRASAASATAHGILDRIPMGQPILVGHHSEKGHRRDISRVDSAMERASTESAKAGKHRGAALHFDRVANRRESPVYLNNRLEEANRNLRDIRRRLNGTSGMESHGTMSEERRAWLLGQETEYVEQVAYWEAQIEEGGGVQYSRENVKKGDVVVVRGSVCKVLRANPKTITVLILSGGGVGWNWLKYPYAEIKEHTAAADLTETQQALVASVQPI